MPKAVALLAKAASRHHERKIGKHKGGVLARTIVSGRSYDHVRTERGSGDAEIHPTNIDRLIGVVRERTDGFEAHRAGRPLGRYDDRHAAAKAVVNDDSAGSDPQVAEGRV